MKELSIEEKAKAYDEAIEIAKKIHKYSSNISEIKRMEQIFPELKESEDKQIRKALISILKSDFEKDTTIYDISVGDIITWLEKQGEMDMKSYKAAEDEKREFVGDGFIKCYADFQDFKEGETYWLEYVGNDNYNVRSDNLLGKTYHITPCQLYTIFKKMTWLEKQGEKKPADKAEPKFKVGDWIVFNGLILHIDEVVDGYYRTTSIGGIHNSYDWDIDNVARLWTIQDAKDGDVLVGSEWGVILMFRGIGNTKWDDVIDYHCYYDCHRKNFIVQEDVRHWGSTKNNQLKPATKEQRDLLFAKMKEAGYELDAEKKKLIKLF